MAEVAIVTDSIACLPPELLGQYLIKVVPLNIFFNGKIYREGVDITPTEAYELLDRDPDKFATSPGSAGDYLEAYREASAQARSVLCITLSSQLSTLYQMATVAKDEARKDLPGTRIEVLDTLNAASGEGLIVLAAARAAASGKDLAEVIDEAQAVKTKVTTAGLFDSISHIYRTGRVPQLVSQLGAVIKIKPLFTITGGLVKVSGVYRSKDSGTSKLLAVMKEKVGSRPVHVIVSHAGDPDAGEKLKQQVASEFNCVELWLSDFSPIMGYATGRGTLALAYYEEN